ncbi:MAG: SPOR domain-containing protein [Aliidongia sp.]
MGPRLYPDESDPPPPPSGGGWSIDPEDRPNYGDELPRRGFTAYLRPLVYGLFAIGCAGALWYAYNKGRDVGAGGTGTVPLIRADQGATKVKPTDTGGASVPDQDKLVYNPSQPGAKVERLLPPPEQPLAKPLPPASDASAPLPVESIGPTAAPKAAPPSPPGEEIKQVTSSGTITLPSGPATTSAPIAAPAPTPAAPAAKPVPLTPAKPPTQTASAASAGGSFRVQIAATRDDAAAKSEWERLKKAHADLLGDLSPTVVKADLGDKGVFYRVQAGPVADHEKAEKLCSELKKFAIACIIVKP